MVKLDFQLPEMDRFGWVELESSKGWSVGRGVQWLQSVALSGQNGGRQ